MAQLLYSVDFEPWAAPLRQARDRMRNLRPALKEMGKIGVAVVQRNIDDRGGTIQWPDLSVATLIARARNPSGRANGGGRQVFKSRQNVGPATSREARVLGSTGRKAVTKRARGAIQSATPLKWTRELYRTIKAVVGDGYVDIGSPLKKSLTLFFGSRDGKKPVVPARSPFGFTPADMASMMRAYVGYVLGAFVKGSS